MLQKNGCTNKLSDLMSDPQNDAVRNGAIAIKNERPMRFDAFTIFTQVMAWSAALSQAALIVYLLAV
ncbi:MAG: hypothetical protein ACREIA_19380 [Opitutaceae bacterium]